MWLGRISSDSMSDMSSAHATTKGNAPSRSPICPLINVSGRKATTLVSTVATTGQLT